MGKLLTREEIERNKTDRSHWEAKPVHVPAWGYSVRIRSLGGDEVNKALNPSDEELIGKTMVELQAEYIAECCLEPVFNDSKEVLSMPYRGIRQLFKKLQHYTGARDEDEQSLVDEAEGNSETTPS